MRQHASEFAQEPGSRSSRPAFAWRPATYARGDAPFDLSALREALRDRPGRSSGGARGSTAAVEDDLLATDKDVPTNVFALAQYRYQLTITTVAMADCELAVLLPRSGTIWFNTPLFKKAPRGREAASREAWQHAVDTSGVVRFLLGWSLAIYSTAHFRGVPHEDLPGWSRVVAFRPRQGEYSRNLLEHWADVLQEVTRLLAPPDRVWRQLQMFASVPTGDRRWRLTLARNKAGLMVDEAVAILADRNQCPSALIRRSLDGNSRLDSYAEYQRFTDELLEDLPSLRSQRYLALHGRDDGERVTQSAETSGRRSGGFLPRWKSGMDDPRQSPDYWQLHL